MRPVVLMLMACSADARMEVAAGAAAPAMAPVTREADDSQLRLSDAPATLMVGEIHQLQPKIVGKDVFLTSTRATRDIVPIAFQSSAPDVVSVTRQGLLVARAPGLAFITAERAYGPSRSEVLTAMAEVEVLE